MSQLPSRPMGMDKENLKRILMNDDNIDIVIPDNEIEGIGYATVNGIKLSFWWQVDYGIYYDTIEFANKE